MTTTNKRITLTAAVLVLAALPAFAQQSSQIRETTAEEPQPARHDEAGHLPGLQVHLRVPHIAVAAAVGHVDDLLVPQLRYQNLHSRHLPAYPMRRAGGTEGLRPPG